MSERGRRSTFVVVTGNPEHGHGQRLSQIRSHTAKRQHLRRATKNSIGGLSHDDKILSILSLQASSQRIHPELHIKLDSPPLASSPTGYNRMRNFMHQYVLYSHHVHPFFSMVICAAVSHPALMSSKILNASAWDDLSTSSRISEMTVHQCHITRILLSRALQDGQDAFSDMNIASLIALLLFDMVIEDQTSFHADERGLQFMINARGGLECLGFEGHLKNSILLIEELKRACCLVEGPIFSLPASTVTQPWPCLDMSLFIFNTNEHMCTPHDGRILISSALGGLYHLVMILKERCHRHSTTPEEYHLSFTTPLLINTQFPCQASDDEENPLYDARMSVLLYATQILNRWSGSSPDTMEDLSHGLVYFKSLLEITDLAGLWGSLPGALIWCLIIGVRLSPPGSLRKWFMMQATRVTCTMTMHYSDAVLRSLRVILEGLDGAERRSCGVYES